MTLNPLAILAVHQSNTKPVKNTHFLYYKEGARKVRYAISSHTNRLSYKTPQ